MYYLVPGQPPVKIEEDRSISEPIDRLTAVLLANQEIANKRAMTAEQARENRANEEANALKYEDIKRNQQRALDLQNFNSLAPQRTDLYNNALGNAIALSANLVNARKVPSTSNSYREALADIDRYTSGLDQSRQDFMQQALQYGHTETSAAQAWDKIMSIANENAGAYLESIVSERDRSMPIEDFKVLFNNPRNLPSQLTRTRSLINGIYSAASPWFSALDASLQGMISQGVFRPNQIRQYNSWPHNDFDRDSEKMGWR